MLTGKRAFEGDDVTDTLAAVLRADVEWGRLPSDLSPAVRTLLGRCLNGTRSSGCSTSAMHGSGSRSQRSPGTSAPAPQARRRWGGVAVAALLSAAVVGPLVVVQACIACGHANELRHQDAVRDASESVVPLALSPDGRQLAYVVGLGERRVLFHQSLNVFDPRPLEENAGARTPFFSPGGDAVGFYAAVEAKCSRCAFPEGLPPASSTRRISTEQAGAKTEPSSSAQGGDSRCGSGARPRPTRPASPE